MLVRVAQETPKTLWTISVATGCHPRWKVNPCGWGYHAFCTWAGSALKASSWGLAFTVPDGALQASKREKPPTVPPGYYSYELQQQLARQDNPKAAVMGNLQLSDWLKVCSIRGKRCLVYKPSQLPGAGEATDLGGQPTTITLLNQHNP